MAATADIGKQFADLINGGRESLRAGEAEEALVQFDGAVKILPIAGMAHFDRGTALHQLEQPERAELAFSIAISLHSEDEVARTYAYLNRSAAREDQGNVAGALADLERASNDERAPDVAERTQVLRSQRDLDDSWQANESQRIRDLLRQGISLQTSHPLVALALLTEVSERIPPAAPVFQALGVANTTLRRTRQALQHFQTVLSLQGDPSCLRAEALFNCGSLLEGEGRHEEALNSYRECLKLCQMDDVDFPPLGHPASEGILRRLQTRIEALSNVHEVTRR